MNREAATIRLSAITNATLGILGTGMGIWISSDAILLDGLFNWISFVMALISLKVAKMVARPADHSFPFGYAAFEPLVNAVKALLVLGTSIFALVGSIQVIAAGGRELNAGIALAYAAVAIVACFSVGFVSKRAARATGSPLLDVDAKNWLINGAVSAAVGVAFLTVIAIKGTALASITPYIDSSLVVLIVLLTIYVPIRMARENVGELLGMAPPNEVRDRVRATFDAAAKDGPLRDPTLRLTRLGRTLFLLVEAQVAADARVADLDAARQKVLTAMRADHPDTVMDLVYTPA